jgi:ribosomal protein S18 acetylase RimI-like enzyme
MTRDADNAVFIRRGVPKDAPAMARVHARSWRATYPGLLPPAVIDDVLGSRRDRVERWRAWLADPDQHGGSFVAELGGNLVGYVFWGAPREPDAPSDVAEVYAIYLDPDAIGRGIGRGLFEAAVTDIAAHDFRGAVLWVLDTNERARRFYEAAGWRPDGATKTEERRGGKLEELRYRRMFEG